MIDPYSETWRRVCKHANDELDQARTALEQPGLPAAETEFQRGRIAALRTLLALTEDKVKVASDAIEY